MPLSGAYKAHPTNAPLGWDCLQWQANLGQLLSQPVVHTDLSLVYRKCVCVYQLVTQLILFMSQIFVCSQGIAHITYSPPHAPVSAWISLDVSWVLGGTLKPRCPQCWQWKQGDSLDFFAPGGCYAFKSEISRRNCSITIDTCTHTWGCFTICYMGWKYRIDLDLH